MTEPHPPAQTQAVTRSTTWSPGLAVVMSFFIPGLGQLYKGRILRGTAFFIGTGIGFFLLVFPAVIVWVWGMVDAYRGPHASEG